jgi:DNA-binding LytR/AlgR family response regulator
MQRYELGYKPLQCVIVEDEQDAQDLLNTYCQKSGTIKVMAIFFEPLSALRYLETNHIDLIFLDINLPNFNGFSLLQLLPYQPKVIFTTAYSEYSMEAFNYNVVDYLLKPIRFERFLKAVSKLDMRDHRHLPESISIGQAPNQVINPREIAYVEAYGNYLKVHSQTKVQVIHLTMTVITQRLEPYGFVRIHKSFLVNTNFVTKTFNNSCFLITGNELPIGISYRQQVLKVLQS